MKTRKQKVISRIFCMVVSILLLASFFAVPVSAADGQYYTFRPSLDPDHNFSYLYFINAPTANFPLTFPCLYFWEKIEPVDADGDYASFEFKFDTDNGYNYLLYPLGISTLSTDGSSITLKSDSTAFLEAGRFYLSVYAEDTELVAAIQARFTIRDCVPISNPDGGIDGNVFGTVYGETDIFDIYVSPNTKPYFNYPRLDFSINEEVITPVMLCLELMISAEDPYSVKIIDMETNTAKLFYGGGTSPNNPVFPSAPGGDLVSGLGSAEQDLLDSSASGLDEGVSIMSGIGNFLGNTRAGGLDLVMFTASFNTIMNSLVDIPGINSLVMISLSLGLFGSLFGLSASIISASSRRSGQAKREAQRVARKK